MSSHTFFFDVSCPSKATVLNVATQAKALTPVNLTEREAEGGVRVLSWSSPYSHSTNLKLTYQLEYRRRGHDWIVVNNITSSELEIEKMALLPGYLYEARVRARGHVGLWSDWSPPVSWMTQEEGVLNLQCVLVDNGLKCSWQVQRNHGLVLLYYLCWRKGGNIENCKRCTAHAAQLQAAKDLLDFTCWVDSSTPELLTVEVMSVRASKSFADHLYFQPPRPPTVQVDNRDGIWRVRWSVPQVNKKANLAYQVCIQRIHAQASEECYNVTAGERSLDIPHSFLLYQTQYMARVQTLPGKYYDGRPSDWSDPVYFTTDSDLGNKTFIYILIGAFVLIFAIILYNALPACHRRLELWKVSIPSPIKSKVLEEISNRKPPVNWAYIASEKTSLCIMQASDNPIIYKGSILECPLMTYVDDSSGRISVMKADWTHHSTDSSSSSAEDSRTTDTSGMSFLGPYILCCQENMEQSESSSQSFSSLSSYDEESVLVPKSTSDSSPVKAGYVFLPPDFLPSTDDSSPFSPPSAGREPSLSELQDSPPAYSPSPAGMPLSHPSGYCLMPRMDLSVAVWAQASAPPPEGGTESQSSKTAEGDEHDCNYVTLSQPAN